MATIDTIKTSRVVSLPGWQGDGDTFECKLKRPSLLAMAAAGTIPNPLMTTARKLFLDGHIDPGKGNLEEEGKVLLAIARAAMVAPSFDGLAERGIELTDEQLIYIWQFIQGGARALDRFRRLTGVSEPVVRGAEVSE